MNTHHPSRVIAGAAVLALVVSFFAPFPVLAEESPPPAEPAAEATPMPADELPVADGAPVEPIPPEAPSGDEAPGDAAAPAASGLADLLAAVPDGTTIAVVDAQGEAAPLVSQEAAEIVAVTDPVWCPASLKAPTPGLNGCTISHPSLAALVADLDANEPSVDGIIWIEALTFTDTSTVSLNGNSGFETMSNFRLTLRGGWDGVSGSKVITPLDVNNLTGGTTLSGALAIANWNADVTLTDLNINVSTPGVTALYISQEDGSAGSITLTRVRARSVTGEGTRLEAAGAGSTGKISVTTGRFSNNGSNGLAVYARGAITLASVVASGNAGGYGATLNNAIDLVSPITLTGVSTFNDNWTDGLVATSNGAITASDLTATGNGVSGAQGTGATLTNNHLSASPTSLGIKLTGTNIFGANYDYGLYAVSHGPIALNSIHASVNDRFQGMFIQNSAASIAQPVTLTGTSTAKYNGSSGVTVRSNGKISISSLTANGNASYGADLVNSYVGYASDVVLTGANAFHDNLSQGLNVLSNGAIVLANLSADRNAGNGAYLDNGGAALAKPVTLSGVNSFIGNQATNLYVLSHGAITISSLTASGSVNATGATLANSGAPSAQKIALTGTNLFADNYSTGLEAFSAGPITVSNLRATGNGLLYLTGNGALLSNSSASSAQPITLTGTTIASGNYTQGLWLVSKGNITAASLTANDNKTGYGAYLNNSSIGSGTVTLTGASTFNGNYSGGLRIESRGVVKANSLTASGNLYGTGALIDNSYADAAAPKDLLLTGTHRFDSNFYSGLQLRSYGAITLSSASASENAQSAGTGAGLDVYNDGGTTPKPITLGGTYTAIHNDGYGLAVQSLGAIKINNATASDNTLTGMFVYNANAGAVGAVTLTGASFFRGNDSGLMVQSRGAITAANLTATGNLGGYGASLDNTLGSVDGNITLTGANVFTGNANGLSLASDGIVATASLNASNNIGLGAFIDNHTALAAKSVTLSGTNTLSGNNSTGLTLMSLGAITINNLTASANSSAGASLRNDFATAPQAVKLTGKNTFSGNTNYGLYVTSLGAISVSTLTASNTVPGYGAWLQNNDAAAVGGVTLSGANVFEDNAWDGLIVYTRGAITVNAVKASGNASGNGALLNNQAAPTPQTVKITGTNEFSRNGGSGLYITSLGAITANGITATDNLGTYGAYLVNSLGSSTGVITLTGTNNLSDNAGWGLWVESYGAITLNSVTASGNGQQGARLYNQGASTAQAIKLTGTNAFNDNGLDGLRAVSMGAISANNITARGNGTDGAYLANDFGPANVTLTGTNLFSGNGDDGLEIYSLAAISLTKVTAEDNSDRGISIIGATGLGGSPVTITCAILTSNGTYGIYSDASGTLALTGVIASGNPSGDITSTSGNWVIVRACPLP